MNNETNPYQLENGMPMPGKELEWAEWGRRRDQASLDSLVPDERERILETRQQIFDRMNSEQSVGIVIG